MEGTLIALIPAVCWGVMPMLLNKLVKGDENLQMTGTGIGILAVACIASAFFHPSSMSMEGYILSFLSGMCWVIGMYGQFVGYRTLGTAMTFPLSTGLQIILNALAGWLILHEWKTENETAQGLAGTFICFTGILLCSLPVHPQKRKKDSSTGQGFLFVSFTTLGYCAYSLLPRLIPDGNAVSELLPQACGIFAMAMIIVCCHHKDAGKLQGKDILRSSIVCMIYGIASVSYLISMEINGMLKCFILSQMCVVIASLTGIFVLHEKREVSNLQTYAGLAAIILGCVLIQLI